MFYDTKVYNDKKFCNRNYFNQKKKEKQTNKKNQMSYTTNTLHIVTDVMLTGKLDDW